jgi:hypothetical protein
MVPQVLTLLAARSHADSNFPEGAFNEGYEGCDNHPTENLREGTGRCFVWPNSGVSLNERFLRLSPSVS